jgi:RNA recognition motif-containing protein
MSAMANTLRSKTIAASVTWDPQTAFDWIADPQNLPRWHSSFCRSLGVENDALVVQSPRGPVGVRFITDDRARILDFIMRCRTVDLAASFRVLPNGEGAEIVVTLVQPRGFPDHFFQEQVRWMENGLRNLRKIAQGPVTGDDARPTNVTGDELRVTGSDKDQPETRNPQPVTGDAETVTRNAEPETGLPQPETAAALPATGRKLFVGNLPYDFSDEALRAIFAEVGEVTGARIARFRGGNRSRGFGFVEMATEDLAQAAIAKLHNAVAGGRNIVVHLARSQESRQSLDPAQPREAPTESLDQVQMREASRDPVPGARPRLPRRPMRRPLPRRGAERPKRAARPARPAAAPRRSSPDAGIVNRSGYEIFPRKSKGGFEDRPVERHTSAPRTSIEASPYFDDTGDVENRPSRGPRHRRPPPRRPR